IWEENDGGETDADSPRQIFVAKGVKQPAAATPCTGFKPSEANNVNGFCFQQVGLERLDSGQTTPRDVTVDPTLNLDPTRPGAESEVNEDACALNADTLADAENPRVAAGTLTPGQPTVPWVVWEEDIGGGRHAIFVSRLVGGDHFELFHPGQTISNRANNAS